MRNYGQTTYTPPEDATTESTDDDLDEIEIISTQIILSVEQTRPMHVRNINVAKNPTTLLIRFLFASSSRDSVVDVNLSEGAIVVQNRCIIKYA
jgi:hypothetical protein